MKGIAFFILGIFMLPIQAAGSFTNLPFSRITTEHGLSHVNVTCILQDHLDYMWFGTNDGLNRYDGYELSVYSHNYGDETGLKSSKIFDIYEDSQMRLWVGSAQGGLALYNRTSDSFDSFFYSNSEDNKLKSNSVFSIIEDKNGNFWLGTDNGVCRLSRDFEEIRHFPLQNATTRSKKRVIVNDILIDYQGKVWFATGNNGLYYYHEELNECIQVVLEIEDGSFTDKISSFYEGDNGRLLLAAGPEGLFEYNPVSGKMTVFSFSGELNKKPEVKSIIEDTYGNYWFGTGSDGIVRMNKISRETQFIKNRVFDNSSLSSNHIRCLYQSRDNTIWAGTANDGVSFHHPVHERFVHYQRIMGDEMSLQADLVNGFYELPDGRILIGTGRDGFSLFNSASGVFINEIPSLPDDISNIKTIVYMVGQDDALYAGTWNSGLLKFRIQNEKISFDKQYNEEFKGLTMLSAAIDDYGYLWICTVQKGIVFFNTTTGKLEQHPSYLSYRFNFSSIGRIVHIINSSKGIWLATSGNGIYHVTGTSIRNYRSSQNDYYSLSNNLVNHVFEDSKGRVWVGTNNGLNMLSDSGFVKVDLNQVQGSDFINAITEDDKGLIWVSTNKGLIGYDPDKLLVQQFTMKEGIGNLQFGEKAVLRTQDGTLLFGGNKGFTMFNPDKFVFNSYSPNIYISDFYLFNERVDILNTPNASFSSEPEENSLILKHDTRVFGFQLVVLNYIHSKNNKYAYFLEGFDNSWNYIDDQRRITFTNLNPGNYTLYYKGANNDGVWSETRALIIEILPPWWETTWFKIMIGIFIITFLYLWIRKNNKQKVLLEALVEKRTRQLKQQNELLEAQKTKLEEADEMKTRFFTNVSHEFRTPITLMVAPLEDLIKETLPEKVKYKISLAHKNANSLLRLVNQVLTFRKIETDNLKVNLSHNNIEEFLSNVFELFKSLAEKRRINFVIERHAEYSKFWFDPYIFERILYNLLSNAFKYTASGGMVRFTYHVNKDGLDLRIEDTGPGISLDHLPFIFNRFYQIERPKESSVDGTGIGLNLTKSLIELHLGQISVESKSVKDGYANKTTGTVFKIHIPNLVPDNDINVKEGQMDELSFTRSMIEDEGHITPLTSSNNDNPTDRKELKLLFVEDNVELRKYLANEFNEGFEILEAENGIDALEIAFKKQPDVIISDIMMPKMNGIDLCKQLKTNIQTSHIPLILLTADTEEVSQLNALKVGADDYIMKPYNQEILKARINNLLNNREILRNKFSSCSQVSAEEVSSNKTDQSFVNRTIAVIEENLNNESFSIELLAKELNISRSLLFKKIKILIDMSVNDFIFSIKIKKACQLLESGEHNISETSFKTGFKSVPHFSKKFTEITGMNPSEFMQKKTNKA